MTGTIVVAEALDREGGAEGRSVDATSLILTVDVDWAPDFMISAVAEQLIAASVRSTWFVTHESSALDLLRGRPDLFELGVHPNFAATSTHGKSEADVLAHCLEIVPEATSFRTHGLIQSSRLLDTVTATTGLRCDVSLFLPHCGNLGPVFHPTGSGTLLRIPYVWEDDVEFVMPSPIWTVGDMCKIGAGLKVLDFHPVHVYLNSSGPGPYNELCRRAPQLTGARAEECADLVQSGIGAGSMFGEVVRKLEASGGKGRFVKDLEGAP